jgi:hypothetical protein
MYWSFLFKLVVLISVLGFCHGFGARTQNPARACGARRRIAMEIFAGNPFGKKVWDALWKLPLLQPGKPGESPTSFGDGANVLKSNILQIYGNEPSYDGAPLAEGKIDGLLEGSLFLGLQDYYNKVNSHRCLSSDRISHLKLLIRSISLVASINCYSDQNRSSVSEIVLFTGSISYNLIATKTCCSSQLFRILTS